MMDQTSEPFKTIRGETLEWELYAGCILLKVNGVYTVVDLTLDQAQKAAQQLVRMIDHATDTPR